MQTQTQPEVAILYADIVGLTELTERLGDARAFTAMQRYLALLRGCAKECAGREIELLGDACLLAFDEAQPASRIYWGARDGRVAAAGPLESLAAWSFDRLHRLAVRVLPTACCAREASRTAAASQCASSAPPLRHADRVLGVAAARSVDRAL